MYTVRHLSDIKLFYLHLPDIKLYFWSDMHCDIDGSHRHCGDVMCQACMLKYGDPYDADERREEIANAMWLRINRIEAQLEYIVSLLTGGVN